MSLTAPQVSSSKRGTKKRVTVQRFEKTIGFYGHGCLFQIGAILILRDWSNAPRAVIRGLVQAEKTIVAAEAILWGCPVMNFKASLPFHGMMQDFATF